MVRELKMTAEIQIKYYKKYLNQNKSRRQSLAKIFQPLSKQCLCMIQCPKANK